MTIYEILKAESPYVLRVLIRTFHIEEIEIRKPSILEPVDWKREMVTDADGQYLGYSSRAQKI